MSKKKTKKSSNLFTKHLLKADDSVALKAELAEEPIEEYSSAISVSEIGESRSESKEPIEEPVEELVERKRNEDLSEKEEWFIHRISDETSLYSEKTTKEILDYLVKLELLDTNKVKKIQKLIQKDGLNVIDAILNKKYLKEEGVGQALAAFFGSTYIRFKGIDLSPDVLITIPKDVAKKSDVVVFEKGDGYLKVAMANPNDLHFIHLLEKKTNSIASVHFTTPHQLEEALKSYPSDFHGKFDVLMARANEDINHLETLDSISQVFDSLVLMAYQRGTSDVHIEPFNDEIRVRFRIDGVLNTITAMPTDFLETIINHIKVLAKLRIDTHYSAQDGRFQVVYDETTINFRVSIMPTHYGEKAVLRLLSSETQEWSLTELGYKEKDRNVIEKHITKTNGMILCCGPTGSGKTTTLYALLKELNKEGVNISTIEDPIEYGLPGILQTQVNTKTNISFAEGLKSLMRQDPDILMIGEIRDFETGNIAVNSSLTGHLVFSTLHANNASLAPLRLLQMDVDPYLIVNTVNLIIAQRLVRKICNNCKTSYTLSNEELEGMKNQVGLSDGQLEIFEQYFGVKESKTRLFKGNGCEKCGYTGYHGRSIIAEVLEVKDNLHDLISENKSESEIEAVARQNGMTTMLEDGLSKVKEGVTTLEEVFRVINQ